MKSNLRATVWWKEKALCILASVRADIRHLQSAVLEDAFIISHFVSLMWSVLSPRKVRLI